MSDDDRHDDDCALCRGEVPPGLVELLARSSDQPGISMNLDEFRTWIRQLASAGTPMRLVTERASTSIP